jgi:hypothetical protein
LIKERAAPVEKLFAPVITAELFVNVTVIVTGPARTRLAVVGAYWGHCLNHEVRLAAFGPSSPTEFTGRLMQGAGVQVSGGTVVFPTSAIIPAYPFALATWNGAATGPIVKPLGSVVEQPKELRTPDGHPGPRPAVCARQAAENKRNAIKTFKFVASNQA